MDILDILGGLLGFLCVFAVLAAVGHLVWIVCAALLRKLFGRRSAATPPRGRSTAECPRCGANVGGGARECPRCGLLLSSKEAAEARDLDAAGRAVRLLARDGELDPAVAGRVLEAFRARRRRLVGDRDAVRAPTLDVEEVPETSPVGRLEQLFARGAHPRELPAVTRQEALDLCRRLSNGELSWLSGPAMLGVARLMRIAGLASRSLAAHERLLERHPEDAARDGAALEAGRFACLEGQEERARRFLEVARGSADEATRAEAERLLARLGAVAEPAEGIVVPPARAVAPPPPDEGILEVIPVASATPAEAVAPATAPPTLAPAVPRRPRRSLGDVLAAFMEERNILWGELVGGLLIVGCSIALVITLWQSLEEVPYFPFLLFAGITAALFGSGQYTLYHWKLESTSRGLLVIALLLAPLNLLVLADPNVGRGAGGLDLAVKGVALLAFAALAHVAARDLIPAGALPGPVDRRLLLTLGVVGTAGCALFVAPFLGGAGPVEFSLLLGVPVACHVLAGGAALSGQRRPPPDREARAFFAFLGPAAFALAVALGFLVSNSGDLAWGLRRLAVPLAAAGAVPLLAGVRAFRGLDNGTSDRGRVGVRTAATGVGLAGLAVMLTGVGLAWPDPAALLAAALLDGMVLTGLAFRRRLPSAHAAALPCLILACLLGFHAAVGNLDLAAGVADSAALARRLASPASGLVLVGVGAALIAAAEGLVRLRRREHGAYYVEAAAAASLAGLLMVTFEGVARPGAAALAYAASAACALAADLRWRRTPLPHAALGLLVATSLWGLGWGWADDRPLWGLALAGEAAALAFGAAALRAGGRFRPACRDLAFLTVVLAVGLAARSPGFPRGAGHEGTAALLALAALLLAQAEGVPAFTWVASGFGLAALVHLFVRAAPAEMGRPLPAALLCHATLAMLGGWAARWLAGRGLQGPEPPRPDRDPVRLFGNPLEWSSVLTSLFAVPLLVAPPAEAAGARAGHALWLGILWLRQAWVRRSPGWFAAFQAALSAAVLFAVTAWLGGRPWVGPDAAGLFDPRSLQAYGVGLAALGLFWVVARGALCPWPAASSRFGLGGWTLDRVVLVGLVVGQLVLAAAGVAPGVVAELTPGRLAAAPLGPVVLAHAYGTGAWVLLGVLAATLTAGLWDRGPAPAVLGLLVLAVTLPVLLAGPHTADLATASALRWGLGTAFLGCSALCWLRRGLSRLAESGGARYPERGAAPAARGLLLGAAGVVLALTAAGAAVGFAGETPAGPAAGSFFQRVGTLPAALAPLAMLVVGLVGTGARERSPAYAFAAGLVAEATVTGGYALAVVTGGGTIGETEGVRLLQLGGLTAAAWALGWMLARPRVFAWRDKAVAGFVPSPLAGPLMRLQVALALAANFLALGGAVAWRGDGLVSPGTWAVETGSPLGGGALALALAAFATWHLQRRETLAWEAPFFTGLTVPVWLACCAERMAPGRGYAVLLAVWPAYTLLWALVPFAPARLARWLPRVAFDAGQLATGVNYVNLFTAVVALRAVAVLGDYRTPAVSALLFSVAVALLAAALRGEHLAFEAALGVNLAVSLLMLHVAPNVPFGWPIYFVQANVAAGAAAALGWLGFRLLRPDWPPGGILLGLQSALGLAVHTLLLLVPLGLLALDPGSPPTRDVAVAGHAGGWLALALAGAAAFLHGAVTAPRRRVHVLGVVGLSAGVMLACLAARWDSGRWLSFHVLSASWALIGFAAVAVGSAAHALRVVGPSASEAGGAAAARFADLFPGRAVRRWLEGLGVAVVLLALRGTGDDPYRPYVPAALTLVVSLMAAALTFWHPRARYVYASGLLLDLVGVLFWAAWGPGTPDSFLLANALGLAVAASFWTAGGLAVESRWGLRGALGVPTTSVRRPGFGMIPFPHLAGVGALGLLAVVTARVVAADLGFGPAASTGPLAWASVPGIAAALVLALWDRSASFPLAGLYALGLTTVGLALHAVSAGPEALGWHSGPAMSAYAALAGAVGFIEVRGPRLRRLLGLPDEGKGLATGWFAPAQVVVGTGALALSVWTCLTFSRLGGRLAGPAAAALLTVAAGLTSATITGRWARDLRRAALVLGVAAAAEVAWGLPDPAGVAPWLRRSAYLTAALALASPVYSAGLPRLLKRQAAWAEDARRLAPVLGVLSLANLLVLLGQEFQAYDPGVRRTPLDALAIGLVAAAIVVQMVTAVRWAVVPGRDPFGLSERGRTLYVYGVEVLLVLLLLHARLNLPQLFTGWAARYWPLLVMLIAYLGVGLGEFCERRGLPVLAGPLQRTGIFLPLLPLLAFWLRPAGGGADAVLGPGPFLGFLDDGGPRLDRYAWLWLLLGGLYAWLAASRRSLGFGLLAALAANFALWSLLAHGGVPFAAHPQFWLIPPALILLAAEHVNRDRLPLEVGVGLRYLGVCLIYVSSTADLFLAGVGRSAVWPVVLAVLAVAGVLAGILLRVRAFLFLGVSFLFVDVFTMVWHAAVDRSNTWVWWVSGIVLGVAILSLFAVFEKRRNDVLRLVEEIRRWH